LGTGLRVHDSSIPAGQSRTVAFGKGGAITFSGNPILNLPARALGEHAGIKGDAQRPAGEHSVQDVKKSTDKVQATAQKGLNDLGGIERTGTSTLAGAIGNTASRIVSAFNSIKPPTVNVNVQVTAGAVQKQTTIINRYGSPNGSAGGAHNHPVNVNGGGP
jgi:hypothetical protein